MNYYERYCGDYAKKTARLTLVQHGAYTLLLDEYYSTEKPLSASLDELYRICRAMKKIEQEAVDFVAEQFFPIAIDGLRHNDRADEMIEKARPKMDAARENGRKGGRPRKNPPGSEKQNPDETQQKPSGKPTGFSKQNPAETQGETTRARSPTPTPVNLKTIGETFVSGPPSRESDDDFIPKDAAEWLRHFRTKHGFEADPTNVNDRKKLWPVFAGWTNAGLTTAFVDNAVATAIRDAREPIVNLPLYVDRCMANANAARASPQRSNLHDERANTIAALTGRNRVNDLDQPDTIDVEAHRVD
jgi:uncharacterized protein YdaU (DUF1376 family)